MHIEFNYLQKLSNQLIIWQQKIQNINKSEYLETINNFYKKYNILFSELVNLIGSIDLNCCISKISIDNIGPVNMAVKSEYEREKERFDFLASQRNDLIESEKTLEKTIKKLDKEAKIKFLESFDIINKNLSKTFPMFFDGGKAFLKMVGSSDPLLSGLEVFASPPGKKMNALSLLSGGEKTMAATALILAVFLQNPSPICVLDEVDAPLDDINIEKYCKVIKKINQDTSTKFIIITHNPITMAHMDRLYGVTMAETGVSKLISVKLEEAQKLREVS